MNEDGYTSVNVPSTCGNIATSEESCDDVCNIESRVGFSDSLKVMGTFQKPTNQLSQIPQSLASYREADEINQEEFSMREPVLSKIDTDIAMRKYVPELILSGKQIFSLPDLDPQLQKVDCSRSALREISCELPSKIVVLILDSNQISRLSDSVFSGCPNLRFLSLKSNSIKVLPKSMFQLHSLQMLDISNNQIVSLRSIWKLESLQ
jgi:Leucine-rich repeat (LRR) protein